MRWRGLSLSLFARFASQGLKPYFLDTQFRMHPKIAQFSAESFYGSRLKNGVSASDRKPIGGFPWPVPGCGIAFIHVDGSFEQRERESYKNDGEAQCLEDLMFGILQKGDVSLAQIGVVTPYTGQVSTLRAKLFSGLEKRLRGVGKSIASLHPRTLEIASVDGFQGREKELIIFSAVRSNTYGGVGFLADWRRLNVMITRARRGLIIVGDMRTLTRDPTWKRYIYWANALDLVPDVDVEHSRRWRTNAPPLYPASQVRNRKKRSLHNE